MNAVVKELVNKGHKTAYLWVFQSNEKAIRFYERLRGIQKEQSNEMYLFRWKYNGPNILFRQSDNYVSH
jgi:hypothetical protein